MKTRLILAAAAVALSACGPSAEPAPPAAATPPAPPPLTAAGPFKATRDGVGRITAADRFDLSTLEKVFPGAKAEGTWIENPDALVPALTVIGENDLSLDVLSMKGRNSVGVIIVYGGPVVGAGGEAIGKTRSETAFTDDQCEPGKARYAGKVLCRRADDPNTAYVFKGSGPAAKIVQIRWQTPGSPDVDAYPQPVRMGRAKVR